VEEQLEDEESDDIYVLSKIADVIHALFTTYREAFLPYFDQVVHLIVNLLDITRPWADRQWGICIFDDVIEFTGPACLKYQGMFLQPLALYVKDKTPEVNLFYTYHYMESI
jgi:importin-5